MATAPHSKPIEVPAARKPEIVVLLHFHVCACCGKPRACEANPCWLRYRSHAKQWAWTCAACSNGPAGPAVAVPIAA